MAEKRRVTYEQSLALDAGRHVARMNQRRRVADRQAAEKAAAERERAAREHVHGWKNWTYSDDYTTETRECRECRATETRPVRL